MSMPVVVGVRVRKKRDITLFLAMQSSLLDLTAEDPAQRLQSVRYASTNYHSLSANTNSLSRKVKHAIIGNKRKKYELANSGLIPRYVCL